MSLQVQQQTKFMISTRSADCLRLDLNTRMEKKNQIKLLNAKIRNLKNKCRALREQSKTDREMLSNLISVTNHLENKTNQGIQACKEVQHELYIKQTQMSDTDLNRKNYGIVQQNNDLQIDSHCRNQKVQDNEGQNLQILQTSLDYLTHKDKNIIYSVPTDRSVTASLKSQGNSEDFLPENNVISMVTGSDSNESTYRRANTISFSPSKTTKPYGRNSSINHSPNKKYKLKLNHSKENLFIKYIYAIIVTIVLTIILFKLI